MFAPKSESKDQRAFRRARDLCEPIRRGHLKLHPQAPGTQIPTEMLLAKQRLDVGLVVDHQSQDRSTLIPILGLGLAGARQDDGEKRVKAAPGSVETSSVPPCCLATMS